MLKLIAAYQANIPIREDILTSSIELPLPRFMWPNSENVNTSTNFIELDQNHVRKRGPTYATHVDSVSIIS